MTGLEKSTTESVSSCVGDYGLPDRKLSLQSLSDAQNNAESAIVDRSPTTTESAASSTMELAEEDSNPSSVPAAVPSHAPDTFPNPVIYKAVLRNVAIGAETKVAIESGTGCFYEIGPTIKNAIFGQVMRGVKLIPLAAAEAGRIAQFTRSNHFVAIKVYQKSRLRAMQGKTAENPLTEITAQQYIGEHHPNLMGQIECCTDDENIYSIMRFCPGDELFDFVDQQGAMEESQARVMFRQVVAGLQHLQSIGVAHRDMSLENVLYDDAEERYIIIDFGMSLRLPCEHNPDGSILRVMPIEKQRICGKRNYIAPEVLAQAPMFNPMLCDIWAAGVILFIALTGVPPVDSAVPSDDRFQMIAHGRLGEMVAAWGLDLSGEVVDLIQRLMRPNPTERLTVHQILQHPWVTMR